MKLLHIRGIALYWILCQALPGVTGDTAVVEIELNGENKGEFVVRTAQESDFLVSAADLKAIGFRDIRGRSVQIEGRDYLSLRSMPGVRFDFDEPHLVIRIQADPILLGRTSIDFVGSRPFEIIHPHDSSFFFNYGLTHNASRDLGTSSFTATQETGMRWGDFLLLSNSIFARAENQSRATRLMTSITHDDRQRLRRIVLGDVYASSGSLGSTVLMGGFSYSKSYSIDPMFLKRPTLDYTGFVTLPSQVDVLVDGIRIRSEKFSPGGFNLKNIPVDGGLHDMEIRIRDTLGREQTLNIPYYSTDALLRKGLHDYSYNAGVTREGYGTESNRYGGLVFSMYHRYGLAPDATIGFHAEGNRTLVSVGPQLTGRLMRFGITDISLSMSAGIGTKGTAASLTHTFLSSHVNVRLQATGYSRHYRILSNLPIADDRLDKTRLVLGAGISYGSRKLGSVSFNLSSMKKYLGEDRESYAVTYARSLQKQISLSTTYQRVYQGKPENQVFVSLTCFLHRDITASTGYQRQNNSGAEMIQVHKSPPAGRGFSYSALLERHDYSGEGFTSVNPYLQYNGKYGVYSAEYRKHFADSLSASESFEVSASGSLVYASGAWGLSRPVDDSFAIVQAGKIQDVRVYFNNHEIGRTSRTGKLVIPSLNAFVDNVVGINDQDIPVNYVLKDVTRYLSPPWRSGTLVKFSATKVQALSGKLTIKTKRGENPVEFIEVTLVVGQEALKFITARDGEFYLENIPAGQYQASFVFEQQSYSFMLRIPKSDLMVVDLGQVAIEKGN